MKKRKCPIFPNDRKEKTMIDICLPGTGGMKPLPNRFLTGLWAEHKGKALLIDCGEGMQIALAKAGLSLARLDTLLITHFHADHMAGLPGLLLSAGNYGKSSPLVIYAPKGGREIIERLCCICPELPFDVSVQEISGEGKVFRNELEISFMPVRHRIDCYCYSITEHRPPVFSPEKADSLGVPINMRSILHKGQSIEVNGSIITPEMVTEGERLPLKITYITDTVYFDKLAHFAADSDLLIGEGMYGEDEFIPKMTEKGHMVFSQSAEIARSSRSKELWLTHYSPALTDPEEHLEAARAIFKNTLAGIDGMKKIIS